MPPSLFRSWRKRDRPQTCPAQASPAAVEVPLPPRSTNSSPLSRTNSLRRPSETISESSGRFFGLFNKGSSAETDTSSLASVDETRQTESGPSSPSPPFQHPPSANSPLASPHSLDRPLPPLPPVRPPRPPSLNLHANPVALSKARQPKRPLRRPVISEHRSDPLPRRMPVLDNVWEGFIRDVEGPVEDIHDFTIYGLSNAGPSTSPQGVPAFLDYPPMPIPQPRTSMYRTGASGSTPHFRSPHELNSDSESEDEEEIDVDFALSQFPAPPPPPMPRRRAPPRPLVLRPTPSIAPLPPSPSFSSGESTPVVTPTTPRYVEPSLRKGILKKPSPSPSDYVEPTTPTTPTTPTSASPHRTRPPESSQIPPPRLRSARSVPHLQPLALANTHRFTSSDVTSTNNRRRIASRPDPHVAQQFYAKAPLPPPPSNVQWGYAV
ncbi:hypothetical protein C8R45DRAFT_919872 [Mycena sanguinolenta]|nr:hypothetical protein C8R45DRAFT_919872 [Mycena sanguinolenta]